MRQFAYFSFAWILVALFGCVPVNQGTYTPTPLINVTLPASLPASSATPIATLTASPPLSSTPVATLETQAAEAAIKQILNQDMPCINPCVFGTIPGETTLEEAQKFYNHLHMNFRRTYQDGKKQYYEAGFGFNQNWSIGLRTIVQDGIVRNVTLGIGFENYTGSTPQQEWPAFQANAIIKKYGPPSDVKLSLNFPVESGFPAGTAWYDIVLGYPVADLIVQYRYELTSAGKQITSCPFTDKSLGMSMWLGKEPPNPPGGIASLAEATTLSLEQFYELLTQESQSPCFKISSKAFNPKP